MNLVFNELYNQPDFPKQFNYTKQDYVFVLMNMMEMTMSECKRLASDKPYPLMNLSESGNIDRWKSKNASDASAANTISKNEKIVALYKFLRPIFKKYIIEYINKNSEILNVVPLDKYNSLKTKLESELSTSNEDDITQEEYKRILVRNIREFDGDRETIKEFRDMMKMYRDTFMKDIQESDTDKVIVQTYTKKEGVCPNCNREIDVLFTARFECPYCKTWLDFRKDNPMY